VLKLSQNPQFTGSISGRKPPETQPPPPDADVSEDVEDSDNSEDEDSDEDVDEVAKTMDSILMVSAGD
jgi:hypothetical protein